MERKMEKFFGRDPAIGVYSTLMIASGSLLLGAAVLQGGKVSPDPHGLWIVLGFAVVGVIGGSLIRRFNRW